MHNKSNRKQLSRDDYEYALSTFTRLLRLRDRQLKEATDKIEDLEEELHTLKFLVTAPVEGSC